MSRRAPKRAVASGLIAAAFMLCAAAPVAAAVPGPSAAASIVAAGDSSGDAPPLAFSTDGATWTASPPAALFSRGIVLVPGGAVSATVWVRNDAPDAGILVAALADIAASSADAAWAFGVTGADHRGAGLPRTAVESLVDCAHVVEARVLQPAEAVPITVTVDLSAAVTGAQAQNDHVAFAVQVGLTQATAGSGAVAGCPAVHVEIPAEPPATPAPSPSENPSGAPEPDSLAVTGGRMMLGGVAVGLAALALGGIVTAVARRKRRA